MISRKKAICLFIFISGTSAQALDLLEYKFSNSYRYALLEDANFEQFNGSYLLTSSLAHISSPFYIEDVKTQKIYREIVKSYDLLSLGASYNVNPKLQIMLETAVVKAKVLNESETALTDTHVKGKFQVWKNEKQAFAISPELIFATGSEMAFTTRSGIGGALRGTYEYHFDKLHVVASLGIDIGRKNTYLYLDNRKVTLAEFGLSYDFTRSWNLNFETIQTQNFFGNKEQSTQEGDFYLTVKNESSKDFSSYAGVGIAGFKDPDKKNKSLFAGIKYLFGTSQSTNFIPVVKPPEVRTPRIARQPIRSKEEEKIQYGEKFTVENLYFANGKTELSSENIEKTNNLAAQVLKNQSNIKVVVIEGFASKVGPSDLNQSLSEERANNAKAELMRLGLAENKIVTVGYGDKKSVIDASEDEERKVQFRVYLNNGEMNSETSPGSLEIDER